MTTPVRVPAWLEPHRDLVARRRAERVPRTAIAAELGMNHSSLGVYMSMWWTQGDGRFAPLSARERSLRLRRPRPDVEAPAPSCRWRRDVQVAAFLRAGHGARTIAAACGLRTQYVREIASRLRSAAMPDGEGDA